MMGKWIFICGPSGVGKDSLIAWSRQALAGHSNIVFARRVVTRVAQPGSDDDAMSEADFLSLRQSGGLCWHWQAHGFYYGISQTYASHVSAGGTVVINGSRSHVDALPASPGIKRVKITASPDKIAARLAQRGRDSEEAVTHRLARNAGFEQISPSKADLIIRNDADLAQAGAALVKYLAAQAGINVTLARPITSA
jgi:phosphonate metabolism protein PhnN/1,5-bisphosphokinase (PRPP-forming)